MSSEPRAARRRAAALCATGTAIPVAVWIVGLPALGAFGLYDGSSVLRPIGVVLAACAAGGAVAGGAMGVGWRPRVAFAVAFVAGLWLPLLELGTLPALAGRERFAQLVVGLVPGFTLGWCVIGAGGVALSGGTTWPRVATAGLVFGAAGGLGGLLLAGAAALAPGASGLAGFAVSLLGGVACLTSSAIAGWGLPGSHDQSDRP